MKRRVVLAAGVAASVLNRAWAQGASAGAAPSPAVLRPGDNLVAEGIPPVPAALAERVGRYSEFRSAALRDWHPTRREMLVGTRFGDTVQLHLVRNPQGARTQLTFFADRVGAATFQPVRGDSFIFSKDTGGGEWYQLYRYDMQDAKVTLLTDGKSRNTDVVWNRTGDRIAYMSTRRNGRDADLYVMDPSQPATDHMLLQQDGGGASPGDWSPDGRHVLLAEFLSINESRLWLVDAASGAKKLLTPPAGSEQVFYGDAKFSHDGRALYVTTDAGFEFNRLARLDLATMQWQYLTSAIPWNVDLFDISEDGRTIAFAANEAGASRIYLMDTATHRMRPGPQLPVGVVGGLRWHRNNRDVGFTLTTARSPADAHSFDVESGAVTRWTASETGGLDTSAFPQAQHVAWKSFDGREISGFLYMPPARFTGKRPVAVLIHGGPEGQAKPVFLGQVNYWLNELGIALVFPNVRGSTGYGKTFAKLDNGFLREDTYKDIDALLDWIKSSPQLDGDRIMVTGGSYGGHMTLAVATNYDAKIACSIDVVGMSNLVSFLEHTEAYRRDLRRVEYGDERDPGMREFLTRIAPMTKARNITKPLFVVQGKNDPRVPASEALQMVETVRRNGTPVWFLMAADEGHGFAKRKNRDFQFYAELLFMERYLLSARP